MGSCVIEIGNRQSAASGVKTGARLRTGAWEWEGIRGWAGSMDPAGESGLVVLVAEVWEAGMYQPELSI